MTRLFILKKLIIAALIFSIVLFMSLPMAYSGAIPKTGIVAAKGLVLGPNDKPIWVEFNDEGYIVREIGEAHQEPFENAFVMSGSVYRAWVNAFQAVEEEHSAHRKIITRDEYLGRSFTDNTGGVVSKPPLQPETFTVMVRSPEALYKGIINPVLHESPIDLNRISDIPGEIKTLLLSEDRNILAQSKHNIGYKTAYYSPKDDLTSTKGQFGFWGYQRGDEVWGPIRGAEVKLSGGTKGGTDENGHYVVYYMAPPSCFEYVQELNLLVKLRLQTFNPQTKNTGYYYVTRDTFVVGGGEIYACPPATSLGAAMATIGIAGINAASPNPNPKVNFNIDLAMLAGKAVMQNEKRPGIKLNPDIEGEIPLKGESRYLDKNSVLRVTVFGQGRVWPNGGAYDDGDAVTLLAEPNPGYKFKNWIGDVSGEKPNTSLTMDGDKTVIAIFEGVPVTLTVTKTGNGDVIPMGGVFKVGENVTLTAKPKAGWVFSGWSGDVSDASFKRTIVMDADKSVTAVFQEMLFSNLKIETEGRGNVHTSPPGNTYPFDSGSPPSVSVTATPEPGWKLERWEDDLEGSNRNETLVMDSNKHVKAVFTAEYELTVTKEGNCGVLLVPPGGIYTKDTVVTLKCSAGPEWKFKGWEGDAGGTDTTVTVTMDSSKEVTAVYEMEYHDRGLLAEIGDKDLGETDVYVYRVSNDHKLGERKGLKANESNPYHGVGTEDEEESKINYRMLLRGPASFYFQGRAKNFKNWQIAMGQDEDLKGVIKDHLKTGEKVKVILINRTTGYMGSGIATVGEGANILSFSPGMIRMRPPNLSIRANREYKIESGLNKDDEENNLIGFEGSGLTSDLMITVSTDWFDWDGSPLPENMPGFTGRLAKVVAVNELGQASGAIANFDIKPGRNLQVIELPEGSVDNSHFYIHVNAKPIDENPNFQDTKAGEGSLLEHRPKHYVPVKVPIFNETATRNAAIVKAEIARQEGSTGDGAPILEDIEKVYTWVYRPEFQFSLFELALDEIKMETRYDDYLDRAATRMGFAYDLYSDQALDPLARFGGERDLVFGLGFEQFMAQLGEGLFFWNPDLEALIEDLPASQIDKVANIIDKLKPEDFLGLQLFQGDDAGNSLYEMFGLPIVLAKVERFTLQRTYHLSKFNSGIPGSIGEGYTDDYNAFKFDLTQPAKVSVKIFNSRGNEIGTYIDETDLVAGSYDFVIDYKTVLEAGVDPDEKPSFIIQLEAKTEGESEVQTVQYPGYLAWKSDGQMLGQIMAHDVLIQDGSLNLSRNDVALKGRGPALQFTRSYNNTVTVSDDDSPLGYGWSHSLDKKLNPISTRQNNPGAIPEWVEKLKGEFFKPSQVPPEPDDWTVVSVNGTVFKRDNDKWFPERGRHGKLVLSGEEFIYTSKDGTEYYYDKPEREKEDEDPATDPTHMSVADSIIYRLGLDPDILKLVGSEEEEKNPADPAEPTKVKKIVDRNGNTMVFNYDEDRNLTGVTDAVGRSLTFTYSSMSGGWSKSNSRLMSLRGPDGIHVTFEYNERGQLKSVNRNGREEIYDYAKEPDIEEAQYNLVRTINAKYQVYKYAYYPKDTINVNLSTFIKKLKSQDVVRKVTYPDNHDAVFKYDVTSGNRRTVRDLRGNTTEYVLNAYGNPREINEPGRTTRMTWSIESTLDDNVMTSKTDGRDHTTHYEYDDKGNIKTETDPYGNSINTIWNQEFSLPLTRIDRNGTLQSWDYDADGNLKFHKNGDQLVTSYTHYPTGEIASKTDPRSNTTNYTYDAYGNPDTVKGPEQSLTDTDYDIRGRLVRTKDPNGNVTTYDYDDLDNLTRVSHPKVTLPAGSTYVQNFSYDILGNKTGENDRNGLSLIYDYTRRNQVKTITRNVGGAKTFDYDENGNLNYETDWKGVATTHDYDDLNQRVSTTNRLNHTMTMGYDLSGNLEWTEDYEGNRTDYKYDKLNRLTDTWQPALPGQTRGHTRITYYDEADPKTNIESQTDPEGNTTTFEYNGRYLRTRQVNALTHERVWAYDSAGNLDSETDEAGKTTTFEYDDQNRMTAMVRTGGIRTEFQYDANGNQTHVTDPRLNVTETKYDSWNRPYKVIDPGNFVTESWYDGEGNVVRVTDGNGITRSLIRDRRGLVLTQIDGENSKTTFNYDLNANVTEMINPLGLVTTKDYDAEDRPETVTENGGPDGSRSMEYVLRDKMGNPLQVKDYKGNIIVTQYNALYLPWRVYNPAPYESQFTETTYYKTGKPFRVTNRRGHAVTYIYDALNRVKTVTDALNQTVDTTYDNVGNVKTVTDKRNYLTENFYDDLHRLVRTERAGIRTVTNEYDDAGNLTAVIDAENNRTEHKYNNRNLLSTTTHPDAKTEKRTYDGVGNLLTHINEESKVTTYTYDKENRQRTVTFAGETTENKYDIAGNLEWVIKPMGNRKKMGYDRFGRLVKVIDDATGLKLATRYEYDPNNNLTHQYDPKNNHVEFTYDELNRKTQHIQYKSGGNLVTQFNDYDAEGNLTLMTDPEGQQFNYVYDELNRQTDASYPSTGSPLYETSGIHTVFDPNNNVTQITETKSGDAGSITDETLNTYDNFDRLDDTTQRGVTIDYAYDNNGNRTLVSTVSGNTTYTFDSRNRLETAVVSGQTTTYTYYPDGKQDTVDYPNGTGVKYTYYENNRVDTVVNSSGAGTISSYDYDYDNNGNRIQQVEVQNGQTETTTYVYDTVDRMIQFTISGGPVTKQTEYTFDGYNRKTETVTENGSTTKSKTYYYNQVNWLTRINDSATSTTITYDYDDNGNTILKTDTTLDKPDIEYAYDSRNQLVEVIQKGDPLAIPPVPDASLGQYDYNADGMRIRHKNSERGNVDYFYDSNAVIEEHNTDNGTLLAHYRYADRLLSLDTGSGTQYYHHDALGSTVNLTNRTGAVQVSYKLDPWGHIRDQQGSSVNRQIFTGQEHDENTGLIYFGARYYDPDTARFITQDSYLGEQSRSPSLHRYLYANSNPLRYIDILGFDYTSIENIEHTDRYTRAEVFWNIEKDWPGPFDPDARKISIGYITIEPRSDMRDLILADVELHEAFAGGSVSYESLYSAVGDFWGRYSTDNKSVMLQSDISGYWPEYQEQIISNYIDHVFNPSGETRFYADRSRTRSKFGRYWDDHLGIRASGALKVAAATGEATAAAGLLAAPEPTFLSKVAGGALWLHASDLGGSGLNELIWGEPHQPYGSRFIQSGLELAIDEEDAYYYSELSYGLLGASGTFGAIRLTQLANEAPIIFNLADDFVSKSVKYKLHYPRSGLDYIARTGHGGRLESVFAKIEPRHIGIGSKTTEASRSWARLLGNALDDAGHGLARNLGGPGGVRAKNIFSQNLSQNRGPFAQYEQLVKREVLAGKEVYVRIVPKYHGPSTRPYEVMYQLRVNGNTVRPIQVFPNP